MNAIKKLPPTNLVKKFVPIQRLKPYFGVDSIEDVLLTLRELRRKGLMSFDIRINKDYFDWQRKRADLRLRSDVLDVFDPFGAMQKDEFGLGQILFKVDANKSLDESVAIKVITALPVEIANRYMDVRIHILDRDKLKRMLPPTSKQKKVYGDIEYMGLKISEAEVSYSGEIIRMPFQEQEVLRILMERNESLVPYAVFESRSDIVDPSNSSEPRMAVSRLISQVRSKLTKATDQKCIYNVPQEGWRLRID